MALPFDRFLRLPRSLLGRLLLASIGALLGLMLLLGAAVVVLLKVQTEPFSWEGASKQEDHLEQAMRFDAGGRLIAIDSSADARNALDALTKDIAYQVLDSAGREVFASPEGSALEVLRRMPVEGSRGVTRIANGAVALQVMTSIVERGGGRYLVRNARSERLAIGIRTHGGALFYGTAVFTSLLAILIFSTIAWWMGRRALQPLEEASEAAAAIRPGNLTQRVESRNLPSEVAPLVEAFNSALGRLEQGYRVQQDFLAAAAHELKTPLTLMRAEIELGNVINGDLLLKDIDLMAIHVQQLLQLAEVSEIQNFQFELLSVREVVEEAMAYLARSAESQNVHLSLAQGAATSPIEADRGALLTLVKNLVENAIHHSPAGGVITIRLSRTCLSVSDEGPGVAEQDVPRLFTRFWRGGRAPYQGAGLGLSICRQIATAHGWSLGYQDNSSGTGAEFRVLFGPQPVDRTDGQRNSERPL